MNHTAFLACILLSGYFHFHALDWNDNAWPHPDERAVVSQTYDMLAGNHYRPTNHTWGHLGYYSTLFSYKAYLYLQHWLNGTPIPVGGPLQSVAGRRLPHFRDMIHQGWAVPIGTAAVLSISLVYLLFLKIRRHRLAWVFFLLAVFVGLAVYPRLRALMQVPVTPDYDDVAYLGRFIAALASMLCLPLLYDLGFRLYSARVGLLAAAFFGFTVLGIQLGHFFAPDMLQAFCVLLAIWIGACLIRPRLEPTGVVKGRISEKENGAFLNRSDSHAHGIGALLESVETTFIPLFLYVALGLAMGMAMAAKFSSAPIFLLPLVVHLLYVHRGRPKRPLLPHLFLVFCYLCALGTWFFLQPYAWENPFMPFTQAVSLGNMTQRWLHILFSREFAAQIYEQSRMIQGQAGGPWVQQFAHSTPYLTMTLQMIRWSFGWPLGLICVGGFVAAVLRNLYRPRAADLLLLAWVAVDFVIVGLFQVTFPRYTIALLPLFCLFGAQLCLGDWLPSEKERPWLHRLGRSWRRLGKGVAAAGLLGGFLYSVAYMQVYDRVHTWTYASLWIYKNVPAAQPEGRPTRLVHEEWDDVLPLDLPPHTADYEAVRMAPYQGDGREKAHRIAEQLAQADWIALPTARLYGTILRVPERYPVTVRYYKMLFAGRLGFTLRKTVTRPATLWGWRFDDLQADESHRVYDHPKCVIFEKTDSLSVEQYDRRILHPPPDVNALTREQIMGWRESPREQLRNILRDPTPDEGALTPPEVETLVRGMNHLSADEKARFLEAAGHLSRTRSLPASALARGLESMEDWTSGGLDRLRNRLSSAATVPGIPLEALGDAALHTGVIRDYRHRQQTLRLLRSYLVNQVIPQRVVLAKLNALDLRAGQIPRHRKERPAAGDAPPNRLALISQGGDSPLYQGWQLLKWLLLIELLGLAVLPLCCRLFRILPDAGYPLAKTLGLVLATYLLWIGVNLKLAYFTRGACFLALIGLASACWLPARFRSTLKNLVNPKNLRLWTVSELLFLLTFLIFVLIRSFNPEIFWGEKTMDFSLYNATMRGLTFPPYEPWFSGSLLNYYYYGYILIGYLTSLTSTPTAYGFNLAMAVIPALTVSGAFSLVYNLGGRVRWGLLGAAFVGFIGNWDPLFQLAQARKFPPMWDSFWASSRAIGQGMINEYPIWSWLFADLHAHVVVMPISLLLLSMIYVVFRTSGSGVWREGNRRTTATACLILAITVGTQLATNIWDFLCYTAFLTLVLTLRTPASRFASPRSHLLHVSSPMPRPLITVPLFIVIWTAVWPALCSLHPYWLGLIEDRWIGLFMALSIVLVASTAVSSYSFAARNLHELARRVALPMLLLVAGSFALFTHFHTNLQAADTPIGFNTGAMITAEQAVRHFGFFILATLAWVIMSCRRARTLLVALALEAALLLVLIGTGLWQSASGLTLYLLVIPPVLATTWLRRRHPEQLFAGTLLLGGWGLAAVSELVVIADRMNTVFKIYHPVWMLLALGSAAVVAFLFNDRFSPGRILASLALLTACLGTMVGTYIGAYGVVTRNLKQSDKPTLNGLNFLQHTPEERELFEAVDWLNRNVAGPQVIAEAFTNQAYDQSTRIAKYTGLPTLLGWPHHIKQRGHSPEEIAERQGDLLTLYTSEDDDEVLEVCRKYRIRYVFVGDFETRLYSNPRSRFAEFAHLREAFHSTHDSNTVFEVLP